MAERVRRSILLSTKMLTRGSRGIKGPVVGWAFLFVLERFLMNGCRQTQPSAESNTVLEHFMASQVR